MASEQSFAPYAPKKTVMAVVTRYRERGLPDPVTTGALEQVGVPASMAPRTLQALRFLGLIDEDGNRLEPFERLKRATTEEYPGQLAEIVRAAYLPVFTIVNPAEDGDVAVGDAFRQYEPSAQREKMVTLFRGLCEESGIIFTQKRPARTAQRPKQEPTARRAAKPPATGGKSINDGNLRQDGGGTGNRIDYQAISAIIQQLPKDARWTSDRRERWLKAMSATIDLLIDVDEPAPSPELHGR